MPITSKVVADSISSDGVRLITLVSVYPRMIHSEVKTHRVLSTNSASSRAIPIETVLKSIEEDPAMFVHWGKNQSGMSAREELNPEAKERAKSIWLESMRDAVKHSRAMASTGAHKQLVNRITEPWTHMETVMTFTEIDNLMALRNHEDAQPEFEALAKAMQQAIRESTPRLLRFNEWHTPFVSPEEYAHLYSISDILKPVKVSVARCARVSYKRQFVLKEIQEDLNRHDESIRSGHMSPTEHQATPISSAVWCGNFRGWLQYRKTIPHESVFNPKLGAFETS